MIFANSPSLFVETDAENDDDDKQRKDDDERQVEPEVERIILNIQTTSTVNNQIPRLTHTCICQVLMSLSSLTKAKTKTSFKEKLKA